MSAKFLRTYSFEQVMCTVNGVAIDGGWGEDGGLEFEMAGDAMTDAVGAAGEVVVNKSADRRVYVDITVKQGSRAATYLGELAQAQLNNTAGPIIPVVFFMRNFITGEVVKDSQAVFATRPGPDQQSEAGERVFRLLLPYAADSISFGTTAF